MTHRRGVRLSEAQRPARLAVVPSGAAVAGPRLTADPQPRHVNQKRGDNAPTSAAAIHTLAGRVTAGSMTMRTRQSESRRQSDGVGWAGAAEPSMGRPIRLRRIHSAADRPGRSTVRLFRIATRGSTGRGSAAHRLPGQIGRQTRWPFASAARATRRPHRAPSRFRWQLPPLSRRPAVASPIRPATSATSAARTVVTWLAGPNVGKG